MKLNNINLFKPISLEEMDAVSLMKRTDTKFVVHINQLGQILEMVKDYYQILEINSQRLMSYNSSYFDTKNLTFYNDHHKQRKVRAKVRVREYLETDVKFIEIKQKSNKGQTNKTRIKTEDPKDLEGTNAFAKQILNQSEDLQLSMSNSFNRFTLVSNELMERVTIDTNIQFNEKLWNENLVIIELKQEKLRRSSPLFKALKTLHLHPASISKYCLGMSSIYNHLKTNNFKPVFRNINKIIA